MKELKIFTIMIAWILCAISLSNPISVEAAPIKIAHRGYHMNPLKIAENTPKSMKVAYDKGFAGVEMDVWEGKDGNLWVYHDSNLARITGKRIDVCNLTMRNRKRYKLEDGTCIKTFYETIKCLKGKKNINIHIKGNKQSNVLSPRAQKKILNILEKFHLKEEALIFARESHMKLLSFPGVKTGWTVGSCNAQYLKQMADRASKENVTSLLILFPGQFRAPGVGKSFVNYAHKRNVKIVSYFTITEEDYNYVSGLNVDYAFMDAPF